jgi:hypothetical protein
MLFSSFSYSYLFKHIFVRTELKNSKVIFLVHFIREDYDVFLQRDLSVDVSKSKYFHTPFSCLRPLVGLNISILILCARLIVSHMSNQTFKINKERWRP